MPGTTRLLRSRSSRRACGNPSTQCARTREAVERIGMADAKQGWPADHVERWPIDRLIPWIVSAEPPIVPRKGGLPNGPMPQSAGLGLARVAAEIPAVERGTWFDMCPGRGAK